MRVTRAGCILAITLVSCGDRTIEPERVCVRARLLPIAPDMITRSGRTLYGWGGWSVDQIELDGTTTTVTSLAVELSPLYRGTLEHDPVSGRMWLLAWADGESSWLYQFDAAGQVEWADELIDFAGPAGFGGSLLHHDDAIVLALTIEPMGEVPRLVVERRDLTGAVTWTRDEIPTKDEETLFRSASLVGVSGDALGMIATPPLIDYGPSYPLTLDFATGETIWLGDEGHDPVGMIADDEHLVLAWTTGPRFDIEQVPEKYVEIERASSSLRRITPQGQQLTQDDVEWPKGWRGGWDDDDLALAYMGDRVVTLVEGSERFGVTVHAADGTLECQGIVDVEFDVAIGPGIGVVGREQWLIQVGTAVEDDEYGAYERATLLLEPLEP